ncbi:FLUCTUATING-LIGHT-ACCLIMATION protein 1, chloroplastic-like [Coffea arabica]|uniref:FLUCTUATING-LIGHT-ACCLIMATION protein 1, chloroplastic-like n=1 Tax=Coffea arabica TaxID=13443 RepID=A0ABM4WQ58_COFAR
MYFICLMLHTQFKESRIYTVKADIKSSTYEGETTFNELSIEERSKLDEETLVNLNNMKKRSLKIKRSTGVTNGYTVVTILVAADGEHELPTINGESDLKKALNKLGSIPSSTTLAVQVLWTPQKEDDVLSEQELLEKYFSLRPL